jgi:josephin
MPSTVERTDDDAAFLYHERQVLALCAVHAVNNLMQRKRYTKADFDTACLQLNASQWFNPHRSFLQIGNYDVNVVIMLLQEEGYLVQWHDRRKVLTAATLQEQDNLVGLLLNLPSPSIWGRLTRGRHWIALLLHIEADANDCDKINKTWRNLDSNLDVPITVGTHEDCARLLSTVQEDSHVLLVSLP